MFDELWLNQRKSVRPIYIRTILNPGYLIEHCLATHLRVRTIRVQYLKIMLSSFGEDFQRFASNFLCSDCLWLLIRRQCRWSHPLNELELHIPKDYCVISKNSVY